MCVNKYVIIPFDLCEPWSLANIITHNDIITNDNAVISAMLQNEVAASLLLGQRPSEINVG